MYIDKLDDVVNKYNKYNNKYYSAIKTKPDVKSNAYIGSSKGISNKDLKFKIGDIVRILKHKNTFEKSYTPKWSEEDVVIKNFINDLHKEKIVGTFYEKELKEIKKSLESKKCNNSFNSWIDKKDIV